MVFQTSLKTFGKGEEGDETENNARDVMAVTRGLLYALNTQMAV